MSRAVGARRLGHTVAVNVDRKGQGSKDPRGIRRRVVTSLTSENWDEGCSLRKVVLGSSLKSFKCVPALWVSR